LNIIFLRIFERGFRIGAQSELAGNGDKRVNGRRAQKDEWVRENRKERVQYNKIKQTL